MNSVRVSPTWNALNRCLSGHEGHGSDQDERKGVGRAQPSPSVGSEGLFDSTQNGESERAKGGPRAGFTVFDASTGSSLWARPPHAARP